MIVLITGASHTGKTVFAQKLLEKYKYPYLSIDHLKMCLIRSGYTKLTPEDDNELELYLWPIIREMIKTVIENKQNLIIEGGYIPFEWKKDFSEEYLEHIKYYCLVMSESYIKNHFDNIKKYANIIETPSLNKRKSEFHRGRDHECLKIFFNVKGLSLKSWRLTVLKERMACTNMILIF